MKNGDSIIKAICDDHKTKNSGKGQEWVGSKHEYIHSLKSRSMGAVGESIVKALLEDEGFVLTKRTSTDHDFIVDGLTAEVKLSTSWDNTNDNFKWQQIRSQQNYDIIFFLGINPNDYKLWWIDKGYLREYFFGLDRNRQHAGKDGNQELYWIAKEQSWFRDISELRSYINK